MQPKDFWQLTTWNYYTRVLFTHICFMVSLLGDLPSSIPGRLKRLAILQKKCIRNVCNKPFNEKSSPLFKTLNILKLTDLYKVQVCKLMCAYTHGLSPSGLQNLFIANSAFHDHNTRIRNEPRVPVRSSASLSRTFLYIGPKLWVELPLYLRQSYTLKTFGYRLKR